MEGIQRPKQREKYHIKDLYCVFEGKDSKSVEGNIKDTVYSSCVTYFHMYYL